MRGKEERVVLAEGKTKFILAVPGHPKLVDMEAKPDITAFDDPAYTRQMKKKPEYATRTTSRVFELLRAAGIPVAYREQISPTVFRAEKCEMVAIEAVARRVAIGSYLKRHPELKQTPPYRFARLKIEFFLKTTGGGFTDRWGQRDELSLGGEEDPLIYNPHADMWALVPSKKPDWESTSLDIVEPVKVIDDTRDENGNFVQIVTMEKITRQTFLVLEKVFGMMGLCLNDFKIEFGIVDYGTDNARLVVADVIDSDSWRVLDKDGVDLSKQAFRDGRPVKEVEKNYELVASLLEEFRVPDQALVVWRGSPNDIWPKEQMSFTDIPGLIIEEVTLSGHKQTGMCLGKLSVLQTAYRSGVILAKIGLSNGLGPILAAHTTWSVIGIPDTAKENPNDVWSSLNLPSNVPMLTCVNEKNAVQAAMNIISQRNPTLWMRRQYEIEELDC